MTTQEAKALAKEKGVSVRTIHTWVHRYGEEAARVRKPLTRSAAGRVGKNASPWMKFKLPGSPRR